VNLDGTIPIADFLGLRPAAEHPDGGWVAEMSALPHTLNLLGVVHGGATATLIDWAAGWGTYHLTGCSGSTTDVFIRYLAAAREGSTLRATTTIDRLGRSTVAATVRVTDDTDRLIAVGNIGYVITHRTS
jgi:acyl-CoA thioesterase